MAGRDQVFDEGDDAVQAARRAQPITGEEEGQEEHHAEQHRGQIGVNVVFGRACKQDAADRSPEQEPGSEKEIAEFCRMTYGVEFPMVGKTVVKGKNANPFYVKLAAMSDSRPKWNFHKYLINHDGTKVVAYTSFTKPDDKDLLKQIDEFLAKKEGA